MGNLKDGTTINDMIDMNIIIAIDESHFGQDQKGTYDKFLQKITMCEGELLVY